MSLPVSWMSFEDGFCFWDIVLGYSWMWPSPPLGLASFSITSPGPSTQEMPNYWEFYRWPHHGSNLVCLKGDESKGGFKTLTSLLNHSKRFLASDDFIFNSFSLVPETPSSSAQLWMMGQGGAEWKERGGDPLPCPRWPHKVKGGYRQIVNPNEHET